MPWMFFDFDVVDAVDVEEVVLVVVGDQPFHLRRVHAAVGLGHVDDRQVETAGRCRSSCATAARPLPSDDGQRRRP